MHSGPSKAAEAIVAVLLPPACREEVLGDLHERYASPRQYGSDALRIIPLIVIARIRRTADPQLLLIQAFALYASFLAAAWLQDGPLLSERWGLARLAIPASMALLGFILEGAYANPTRRSPPSFVRGPLLGVATALLSQCALWAGNPALSLPPLVALYGCGMSLLLSSAIRMLFPPVIHRLQGAAAHTPRNLPAVGGNAAMVAVAILLLAIWIAYRI